ncbi:MAG TPA: hypothetical protein VHO72_06915 [Bacteroidales bacterium]|nr:hypothetical protein [Bacteroidales bacterium]
MNIETRKINLINWISTLQEDDILNKVEKIQKETTDWWDTMSNEDKAAINEGLEQLDKGQYLTRAQVRDKIKERFSL